MEQSLFEWLKERGYIYQMTHPELTQERLDSGEPICFYLGIDPTADSLHIGHFFALMMFRHLQQAGHKGILVVGGATALVGDPSGKSDMRKMLPKEQVTHNIAEVIALAKHFISTDGPNPAIILNNAEWFSGYDYVDFMRNVGVNFNINTMLAADAYKNRLKEGGLTFLEMGYMLMQAYDFVYLNEKYGCTLEIGGSDQWGNIVAGTSLYRKMNPNEDDRDTIVGLTCPLLLTKEGKKMGKTESGTLWVARDKTTPYDFYQYFYNVDDADVKMLLKLFTTIDSDKIEDITVSDIIEAKRLMAFEVTRLVHGEQAANEAVETAKSLFGGDAASDNAPAIDLEAKLIEKGMMAVDLGVISGLFGTKGEARRTIAQGGFYINGERVANAEATISVNDLDSGSILLRKGKKRYLKVNFS